MSAWSVADYLALRRGNLRTVAASCRGEAASLLAELECTPDGPARLALEHRAQAEELRASAAERSAALHGGAA